MASSAKSPRYRWKEEREADLVEFVEGRVRDGASITQALKEYGERHRMSWLTARWKYYQVRHETGAGRGKRVDEESLQVQPPEDDFLGYLQDLVRATEESGQDIVPFIKGFARMAVLSKESMRLREELLTARERLGRTSEELREHHMHLSKWLEKGQVEKVSSLKEFSELMGRDLSLLKDLLEQVEKS